MCLKTKATKTLQEISPQIKNRLDIDSIKNFLSEEEMEKDIIISEKEESIQKPKYKIHLLDVYVIFSITSLIVFTVISQWLAVSFDVTLEELTRCFFAAFGGEILAACLIKIFKLRKHDEGGES